MANTGTACTPLIKVTKKLLYMPIFDNAGARNYIDLTGDLDAAYFSGLINDSDGSQRLFPLPEMKAVEDTRGDAVTEDFADGTKIFIRDGSRAFSGMIVGKLASTKLKGKIEAARCGEMGVFNVDADGNIIGIVSEDQTKLYPIRLDSESISATFIQATDTTIQKLNVKFNYHPDENDACLGMITADELDGVDALVLKGLLDLTITATTPTATGVVITLKTEYGSVLNPVMAKGFVAADFTFVNVTDSGSSIAITGTGASFTETADGVYTIVYKTADDPTVADVVKVTVNKTGYAITSKNFTTA